MHMPCVIAKELPIEIMFQTLSKRSAIRSDSREDIEGGDIQELKDNVTNGTSDEGSFLTEHVSCELGFDGFSSCLACFELRVTHLF